jgi:hypothetical protein
MIADNPAGLRCHPRLGYDAGFLDGSAPFMQTPLVNPGWWVNWFRGHAAPANGN